MTLLTFTNLPPKNKLTVIALRAEIFWSELKHNAPLVGLKLNAEKNNAMYYNVYIDILHVNP